MPGGKMVNRLRKGNESLRGKILEMVKQGQKTLKAASLELGICYRLAKRIYQCVLSGGDKALIHGNKGRPSNHRIDEVLVEQAVSLYAQRYRDFGPTLAQEKLFDRDGLETGVSTLMQALIAAGLWKPQRGGSEYRARRNAPEHFGELVQFDGCHHDWFEERRGDAAL
jgi:hypothetical protein